MDKYFIANMVVWLVIIFLGWMMWKYQKPFKLTLRGGFIFSVLVLYWGAITGLSPYWINRAMVEPCAWRFYTAVPVVIVVWLTLLLVTRWIKVTWLSLTILLGIVVTSSLRYNWPFYYFPGMSGRVVDMDSGTWIKDAVVEAKVVVYTHGSPGGAVGVDIRSFNAVTNTDGEYRIGSSIDFEWWPLTKLDSIEVYGMHVLTAQTQKRIAIPKLFPTHVDIELMSVKKNSAF